MGLINLHGLPWRAAGAATNMALDQWLLDGYPQPECPRWRPYGWAEPAVTLGYGQAYGEAWATVSARRPPPAVVRRPTGGGIVDHRGDFTYALVVPRAHAVAGLGAATFYCQLHEAVAAALAALGVEAALAPCGPGAVEAEGVRACFARAEPSDVIEPATGAKIAGAALKRTRMGLLAQGSVDKAGVPGIGDWGRFGDVLGGAFGRWLGGESVPAPDFRWPDVSALAEAFASSAWNQRR